MCVLSRPGPACPREPSVCGLSPAPRPHAGHRRSLGAPAPRGPLAGFRPVPPLPQGRCPPGTHGPCCALLQLLDPPLSWGSWGGRAVNCGPWRMFWVKSDDMAALQAESEAGRRKSVVRVSPLFQAFVLVFSTGSRQVDHSWPRGGGTGGPHPLSQGDISVRLTAPGARQGPEGRGPRLSSPRTSCWELSACSPPGALTRSRSGSAPEGRACPVRLPDGACAGPRARSAGTQLQGDGPRGSRSLSWVVE